MRVFTSHFRDDADPVMVMEGFSTAAALFGWLWFLLHRAWIPALLDLAMTVLLVRLDASLGNGAPLLGYIVLRGMLGRDALRWGLARRGYSQGPIVAAADQDSALARLVTQLPGRP